MTRSAARRASHAARASVSGGTAALVVRATTDMGSSRHRGAAVALLARRQIVGFVRYPPRQGLDLLRLIGFVEPVARVDVDVGVGEVVLDVLLPGLLGLLPGLARLLLADGGHQGARLLADLDQLLHVGCI